nr:hypothetical protein [uncultured Acetatifactor sp.]
MRYMVMECRPSYVILLDENGYFLKAANLYYEVGQTVYNPVLMREKPENESWSSRRVRGMIAAAAACLLLAFGLGYYRNHVQPYSSIYLEINPAIRMELNRRGEVIALTGTNEEGRILLEGYSGKGKDKVTVADELIDRAIYLGFLQEGGLISFAIDAPDQELFQEYGIELRTEVAKYLEGRITVTIEVVDFDSIPEGEQGASAPTEESPAAEITGPTSASEPTLPTPEQEAPIIAPEAESSVAPSEPVPPEPSSEPAPSSPPESVPPEPSSESAPSSPPEPVPPTVPSESIPPASAPGSEPSVPTPEPAPPAGIPNDSNYGNGNSGYSAGNSNYYGNSGYSGYSDDYD